MIKFKKYDKLHNGVQKLILRKIIRLYYSNKSRYVFQV